MFNRYSTVYRSCYKLLSEHFETWFLESRKQSSNFIGALINEILVGAVALSASDIHFQPDRNDVEVRFRLDGVLHRPKITRYPNASKFPIN
jgi:type II secretory ATPase GspE/PulE/Tfp pilus assembly ATPase PilB-like protein